MFFILVDTHSKWPEIIEMKTTTSTKAIEVLRSIFSRNGISAQIVSDNGSQFSSDEFATYMKRNDVAQETAANYVTLKIIILTSSIKRWIGCRLI